MSPLFDFFRSMINSCFGNGFCSLCCATCPACKGSTSTRIAYGLFLLVSLILSCLMLIPGLEPVLRRIPSLCHRFNESPSTSLLNTTSCSTPLAFFALYRLSFAIGLFFFLFALLMIKVKSSNEKRAKFQNGFWALKILMAISLVIGAYFLPAGQFDRVLIYFGYVGGFLFILIQLVLSIDFVHSWNESWVDYVESGSRKHGYGLLLATFFFYAATVTGIVLFYIYYGRDLAKCRLNVILISVNALLCLILSIISILPSIREYNSSCGLLQSSFVSLYITYFTWSAMSSHPNSDCNPNLQMIPTNDNKSTTLSNPLVLLGLILLLCALLYSIITSSRNSRTKKFFFPSSSADSTILDDAQLVSSVTDNKWLLGSEDHRQQRVYDDERGSVAYNYSFLHLMFSFAALYAMMILTNWTRPSGDSLKFVPSLVSMWLKIVSTWLCVLIYLWTCVAPAILPDRDFS